MRAQTSLEPWKYAQGEELDVGLLAFYTYISALKCTVFFIDVNFSIA